ncbi:16962_t:CDS:10 [Entrophospora sp. SA101]|nr:16962_t:CDS:10 [Entrophospora sp. SA101]
MNSSDSGDVETDIVTSESRKTEFNGFLKTLSTFTGDIYSLTCPSFLLSGVSTLEYGQYWADYPELFADISKPSIEVDRAINVFRWYVSTLYGSFSSRKDKEKIEKKPFNPILGEQFFAKWNDINGCGETSLFSEQVSHHPPVSAFYLENKKAGVSANGHTGQKSQFRPTAARIDVIQVGHILIRLRDHPEHYLITLPSLQILGLWRGAPYVELSGTSVIQSENYKVIIEFSGKGWLSGEKHSFNGVVRRNESKEPLYVTTGTWSGRSSLEKVDTKEKSTFLDIENSKRATPIVAPIDEQGDLESRKLWRYVAKAINEGDFATASKLKSEIEQRQRDKVKNGVKVELQYFEWNDNDQLFFSLDKLIDNKYQLDDKYKEKELVHEPLSNNTTSSTMNDTNNIVIIDDNNKLNEAIRSIKDDPEANKAQEIRLSAFAVFLAALDQTIVSTALPAIASEFKALDQIAWVATAYLLTMTALQTTYGKLSDIFGRKSTFLFSIIIFEIASLLCGLAPNMEAMIIFRALGGIGGGGIISLVIIIISEIVPTQDRGKYQGLIGACFGIASVVGPLLGGAFTDHVTWRWAFYINLPLGVVTIVTVVAFLKLPGPTGSLLAKLKRVDYYGTVMIMVATILLLLSLSWGGSQYAWNSAIIISLLCVGALCFVAFGLIESKIALEPVAPPHLFKNLNIVASFAVNFFHGMVFFGFIYYAPLYFQIVKGESATASGLELLPYILGVVFSSIIIGQLVSRTNVFSFRTICMFGAVLVVVGSGLITTWTETTERGPQIGYMLITGFGVGSIMQTTILLGQQIVSINDLAPTTALLLFFRFIGAVFGVAVIGTIFQNKLEENVDALNLPPDVPVDLIKQSVEFILHLPDPIRGLVISAYVRALHVAFIAIVPLGGVTLISSSFLGSHKPIISDGKLGELAL